MSCKTVTVFSSKGGVGKTFVTLNLATALTVEGYRVLLIDLDLQAGQDMARMLNLAPRNSIVDILPELNEASEVGEDFFRRYAAIHSSGLHFLPIVKGTGQISMAAPDAIKPFFNRAVENYDYILIDAGKQINETVITALDYSNLILLVGTPDILAVYQIKWCLDVLQGLQFPTKMIKMILNRSESRGSVAWQEVRSALTCEIFGHVPSDGKTVGMALNRGIPCVIDSPRSKVAEAFNRMANLLKKDGTFVENTGIERQKSDEGDSGSSFWKKYGASQQMASKRGAAAPQQDDEFVALKRKIHERLVERLNLDGISPDELGDTQSATRLKKTAEEVVGNILLEEAGARITSHEERIQIVADIVNEALGLGPLEDFLADPEVTDIMVNSRHEIYVEKAGKLILTKKTFVSDQKMRAIIDRIIAPLGRRIDESTPMVDARLPDGSRINAIIPPLSLNGPMITIRKFGQERITSEELLNKYNSLSKDMGLFLKACVLGRKNIIVSGGTGAGKTSLLNIISEFIPDGERLITIEDAAELRLKKSHWARLESRPRNIEGKGEVTIRDLFINSLRMRPDRIVIGECRGPEILDMLQAMNTGHEGSLTTLHANSTRDVITRMHSMILLSGIELPVRAINEMIASALDIIVHINRFSDGSRKITGISEIVGLDKDFHMSLSDVFVFKQSGIDEDGKILGDYAPTGYVPLVYEEFVTRGLPIDKNMFDK